MNKNPKWKTLIYQDVEYDNYEINTNGIIRNFNTKHELKVTKQHSGTSDKTLFSYSFIGLEKRGKTKMIALHRAVAETFLENPNKYKFVLFKDGNSENIQCDNLYWSPHRKSNKKSQYKRNPKSNIEAVSKRRRKLKEMSLEYMGSKCKICGYNKCVAALEFHHLDPTKKDFGIATSGTTKSWERIKKELDKCICVCANCHREIHNGVIDINKILLDKAS